MSKRELIDTGSDKRYVRRDRQGKFEESVAVAPFRSTNAIRRRTKPSLAEAIAANITSSIDRG